jgi:methylthioribose-1-phosphate isomerase
MVRDLLGRRVRVLTHCNAGGLACVEWGTALGVVRALHEAGEVVEVFADETRPLLQGARLTAWELGRMGVPHRVVADGAGPSVVARGLVDFVIVGADRVAANGDVVNKVGTYPLALAAARADVPFVVAAPESTVDLLTATGADVHIEERDPDEVLSWQGVRVAAEGAGALNLAFDVTPFDLVTALVTERRVVRLGAGERLAPYG